MSKLTRSGVMYFDMLNKLIVSSMVQAKRADLGLAGGDLNLERYRRSEHTIAQLARDTRGGREPKQRSWAIMLTFAIQGSSFTTAFAWRQRRLSLARHFHEHAVSAAFS